MISMNLQSLRKIYGYTQEYVAEKVGVSRQTVAKWESGDSLPDITSCISLAELYKVKIDDLIKYSEEKSGIPIPPKGKHFFGSVIVGERGQIVIPKEARELFKINPSDKLLILGDEEKGLAIVHQRDIVNFIGVLDDSIKGDLKNE